MDCGDGDDKLRGGIESGTEPPGRKCSAGIGGFETSDCLVESGERGGRPGGGVDVCFVEGVGADLERHFDYVGGVDSWGGFCS